MTRRRARGAVLAVGLLVAGCGVRGKDQGSVINRRLEGEPKTLNALLITSDPDQVVLSMLSRNLLDYDAKLTLVPGLAESVEGDAAQLAYTVKLRPDARWEDGTPVTADDVVYTITALMDEKTPSLNRRGFFEGFQKAETLDERTARVTFSYAYAGRRDAFNLPLLPAAKYRGTDILTNPRNRAPLANGPYRLSRWESGRAIELVRNTQYFGEKPPAERVVFRVLNDAEAAFEALKAGDIDEMRLSYKMTEKLDALPETSRRARRVVYDDLAFTFIGWNNRSPLFSDARVRRALTMLLDRDTIVKTLYGGLAKVANGPVPPGLWSYDATLPPWPHDVAAAEALLDEAGFKRGKDGVRAKGAIRFAFDLALGTGSDLQRQIGEITQQSFRKAGVAMTLRPMEWAALSSKVDEGDFQACLLGFSLDPNPDLAPNWHSSQIPPNGLNSCFYKNARADALMDELKTTFDRARAKELYGELQRVIHEDEPASFLVNPQAKWGVSTRLENVEASPIGLFLIWPGGSAWRPVRVKTAG
jgi:peptide/nickel transport system substrate-binding protein